jgi:hypothetical protein
MAAAPKILNTLKPLEASDITTKKRLAASRFFNVDGADRGTTREDSVLETSKGKKILSNQKQTGRPKDSSDFTAYRGSQGIQDDAPHARGQIILNSSDPASHNACIVIPTTAPTKDSSTITRERLLCHTLKPPVHTSGQVAGPVFVDNTIRIPQVNSTCCPLVANHAVKAIVPFQRTTHGPTKFTTIGEEYSSEPPRKTGLLIARPKYIEKHHGNDLNVNPQRPFVKYQPAQGLPVGRINVPRFGQVKPLNGY